MDNLSLNFSINITNTKNLCKTFVAMEKPNWIPIPKIIKLVKKNNTHRKSGDKSHENDVEEQQQKNKLRKRTKHLGERQSMK